MKRILISLLLVFSLCFLSSCEEETPLDEIKEYYITIHPTEEGNLQMLYHIRWKVLDSTKEGPLEWVRIGIPNQYITDLHGVTDTIRQISFSSSEGDVVRIDLDRSYYANEEVVIGFSFIQTHIYTLKDDEIQYQFIPGWFEEIKVTDLRVYWEKDKVIYENSIDDNDKYFIWQASLDFGESIEVNVKYKKDAFINISKDNTYPKDRTLWIILSILIIIIFIGLSISFIVGRTDDGYYSYRGFSGKNCFRYSHFIHRTGVNKRGETMRDPRIVNHSGGSHSSSCACACACAGGGRAGCSRKEFYNSNLEVNKLINELEKHNNKRFPLE